MMNVLAINSGSSSLKFKIVDFDESQKTAARFTANSHDEGLVEDIGQAAKLTLRPTGKTVVQSTSTVSTHTEAVRCMMQMLEESSRREGRPLHIDVVGHQVVHGGEQFREAVVIDNDVVAAIDQLAEFAPLHNPGAVAGIEGACAALGSHIPMVAVFDTAFHRSIPARASTYAIVRET